MAKAATKPSKATATTLPQHWLKMLVYGQSGSGKTTLACSGVADPRMMPGLLVNFEGGTLSVRSRISNIKPADVGTIEPEPGKLDVVDIASWRDFVQVQKQLEVNPGAYRFVCLDSLSEAGYLSLLTLLGATKASQVSEKPEVAELQDFLKHSAQMEALIRLYRDLPLHVLFICGLALQKNPRTKLEQAVPNLTGKLVGKVTGLVDTVGYLDVRETIGDTTNEPEDERVLFTTLTDAYVGKDRSEGQLLGREIIEPTLPQIFDLLHLT